MPRFCLLLLLFCGHKFCSSQKLSSGRPDLVLPMAFKPYGAVVLDQKIVVVGKRKLDQGEDVLMGEDGEFVRQRPAICCFDSGLKLQWSYIFNGLGYRSEIVSVQVFQDSLFLCLMHVKPSKHSPLSVELFCLNAKGQFKTKDDKGYFNNTHLLPTACYKYNAQPLHSAHLSVLSNGLVFLSLSTTGSVLEKPYNGLLVYQVQLFDSQFNFLKSGEIPMKAPGYGEDVNDVIALGTGYVLATDNGLTSTNGATLVFLDQDLKKTQQLSLFPKGGAECNALLAFNDSTFMVGSNTYNRAFGTGLGLTKLNANKNLLYTNEWGDCIHDDIIAMHYLEEGVFVGHQSGSTIWKGTKAEKLVFKSGVTITDEMGRIKRNKIFYNGIDEHTCGFNLMSSQLVLISSIDEYLETRTDKGVFGAGYVGGIIRLLDKDLNCYKQLEFGNF